MRPSVLGIFSTFVSPAKRMLTEDETASFRQSTLGLFGFSSTGQKVTLRVNEVPLEYRDDYINSGYRRPGMTMLECLLSLFQWNNETLNVWTHYFTLVFFLWKFYALDVNLISDPDYWPLLAFAIGACAFPTLSCIAHTFSSMTVNIRHICFFCDYAGISLYSIGSSVAYFTYTIPQNVQDSFLGRLYLPINVLMAVFCCYICCTSRDKKWRKIQSTMRVFSFAIPYTFATSFLVYKICISKYSHSLWFHYSQFFWCCLTAFINSAKIPEKYIADYFDVVGHSHQWFHIFVFVATNHQINAVVLDMVDLKKSGGLPESSFLSSVGWFLLVLVLDASIIVYFTHRIFKTGEENTNEKKVN